MLSRLIVIPTLIERRVIDDRLGAELDPQHSRVELCGFGPITAAATTSGLISEHQPEQVTLLGIAGGYRNQALGSAYTFREVACYGVGAGSGDDHVTADELGWSCFGTIRTEATDESAGQLLTCCAASNNEQDVVRRLSKFPNAVAEDMEAYGVAVSCQLAGVPLRIFRGISNRAGDRNKDHWQIESAAQAAAELFLAQLKFANDG